MVLAPKDSTFDAFCGVRDPPTHTAPSAEPVGRQLSDCRGFRSSADLQIEAVWHLNRRYAFQIQVTNALPSSAIPTALEAPFLVAWRLCFEGCRQMRVLPAPAPLLGFQELELIITSRVLAASIVLVVRVVLSTSMPPRGKLLVQAPSGYDFPPRCGGLTSRPSAGYFALPWGTACEGGASASLPPHEAQLILGDGEGHRLLAHKPYTFSVGARNPNAHNQPLSFQWLLSTATADGQLLDATQMDWGMQASRGLLLPLQGLPLQYLSPYAGVQHSVLLAFRVLGSDEGGDGDLVPHINRLELHAPMDPDRAEGATESTEWDLSNPSACTTPFVTWDGFQSDGLRHGNITTPEGAVACFTEGQRALSLTFRPSTVSTLQFATLEFAVRNPATSPATLWNTWRVRVLRLRPSAAEEAADRELAVLAAQRTFFVELCETSLVGYQVVPAFLGVQLQPSSYAVNETSVVTFELQPRSDVPRGAVLTVVAPPDFTLVTGHVGTAAFSANSPTVDLELLPDMSNAAANEASLRFVSTHPSTDGPIRFSLVAVNPANPSATLPLWDFSLRAGADATSTVLQRTLGLVGYRVHTRVTVAGLFGSVREIGSRYNFVRITFSLPTPLPREGIISVTAPPGYTLLLDGFSPEQMPPRTELLVPAAEVVRNPSILNISVLYGLDANKYYAFRFAVENPVEQSGSAQQAWELWCYGPDGAVAAANRDVHAFELEARFHGVEVLPSSIMPLRSPNVMEVQIALSSSALTVIRSPTQQDRAFLHVQLPVGFHFATSASAERGPGCDLALGTLGPSAEVSTMERRQLMPLPKGSRCSIPSPQQLSIEVEETLLLSHVYHFAIELENPLETPLTNSLRVSTERNGALLHLAVEVSNFAVASVGTLGLVPTDVTQGISQLLHVEVRPPRHVRGSSAVELLAPPGFGLSCRHLGAELPLEAMPADSRCRVQGEVLQIVLPPPVEYAPYLPSLVAGGRYRFAVSCANPDASMDSDFQIRLIQEWPEPGRILGLRADLPAPSLGAPLELFDVSPDEVRPAGQAVTVAVRFRAPAGVTETTVQAILLEGPVGMRTSAGVNSPCDGFSSRVREAGDSVLPESVCSGISESGVVIQMPESLVLGGQDSSGLTYVFELQVQSPEEEPLVDSFLLALLPGPGAAPIFSGSAPGFAGAVVGLQPVQLPVLPREYAPLTPRDSELPPLSTVRAEDAAAGHQQPGAGLVMSVAWAVAWALPMAGSAARQSQASEVQASRCRLSCRGRCVGA